MDSSEYEHRLEVRAATQEELPTVIRLLEEGAAWLNSKGIHDQWRPGVFIKLKEEILEEISLGYVYLLFSRNEPVATMTLRNSDDLIWEDDADALYLHRFTVSRDHQGNSYGDWFLKWAEKETAKRGKTRLRVNCIASNSVLNKHFLERDFLMVGSKELGKGPTNLYEKEIKIYSLTK